METKQRAPKTERISLSEDANRRLDEWLKDLRLTYQGIKIRRKSLIEWLVLSHSIGLSASEKKCIKDTFFDDLQFAQWMVSRIKRAKDEGRSLSVRELIGKHESKSVRKKSPHPDKSAFESSPVTAQELTKK